MAKKAKAGMNTKQLLGNILAIIGTVLLIFPMFLALYSTVMKAGGEASDPITFKIFNDWSDLERAYSLFDKTFASALATMVDILAIALLVIAAVYVLLFVLQLAGVGKINYNKLKKLLAVIGLVLTIAVIVLYVIFCIVNSISIDGGLLATVKYSFLPTVGAGMLFIGGLVFSVSGMIASGKK